MEEISAYLAQASIILARTLCLRSKPSSAQVHAHPLQACMRGR